MFYKADVAILGGGLTGIFAGLRLSQAGASAILIDDPLPAAHQRVGGFASFSGAKFSLPPAGLGLLPVAGGIEKFKSALASVLSKFGLGAADAPISFENDERSKSNGKLRKYHSFVLTPSEIDELLLRLSTELSQGVQIIQAKVVNVFPSDVGWRVKLAMHDSKIEAKAIFHAAGRLADDLLTEAGAIPTDGKGLDIGVRLEFIDRTALMKLRDHGPDAKILSGNCRTFCLNVPGKIYRYPFSDISIPGGIVANLTELSGNVGILLRVPNKRHRLAEILTQTKGRHAELIQESSLTRKGRIEMPALLRNVFGEEDSLSLQKFCHELSNMNLIDFRQDYRIHLPLLDWHWQTFAAPGTHRTTLPNIFALGDSAGHARGLLQAALSGWLAAEEYLAEQ